MIMMTNAVVNRLYIVYKIIVQRNVLFITAQHIQLSQSMFAALSASHLGYVMRERGELEIKAR